MEGLNCCDEIMIFHGLCAGCNRDVSSFLSDQEVGGGGGMSSRGRLSDSGSQRSASHRSGPGHGSAGQGNNSMGRSKMVPVVMPGHDSPQIHVSAKVANEMASDHERHLKKHRKLALIVDLDRTVLHTTTSPVAELWRKHGADVHELGSSLGGRYFTRIRPGVAAFLQRMQPLFEMHVYTMGTRMYAANCLAVIDPTREFFSDRILSKDESLCKSTKTRTLEALFPKGTHMVAVIDDTPQVWRYSPNLVAVAPYEYFLGMEEANLLSVNQKSEGRGDLPGAALAGKTCVPDAFAALLRETHRGGSTTATSLPDALADVALSELRYMLDTCDPFEDKAFAKRIAESCGVAEHLVPVPVTQHWVLGADDADTAGAPAETGCVQGAGATSAAPSNPGPVSSAASSASSNAHTGTMDAHRKQHLGTQLDAVKCLQRAGNYVDLVLPEGDSTTTARRRWDMTPTSGGTLQVLAIPVADGPDPRTFVFLVQHIACAIDAITTEALSAAGDQTGTGERRCGVVLSVHVAEVIAAKSAEKAVWIVKDRLYYRQYRSAVLLLRVFRRAIPSKYWGPVDMKETELLGRWAQELGTSKRLVAKPLPAQDTDTVLETIGDILTDVHQQFYQTKAHVHTVPAILATLKHKYSAYRCWSLTGVHVVFSGLIARGTDPERNALWVRVREMGGDCSAELRMQAPRRTTHLVARSLGTEKCKMALQIPGCVIIAEAWLHECFRLGRRVDEAPYVLAKPQAAVGAASSVRVHADKSVICDNRSTADILPHGDGQGVVPVDSADVDDTLLELSSATRAAMDQEVLDAMESDSASEADSDTDGMGGGTDNAVDANDTTDSRIVGVEHITGVQDGKITDHDRANGHHTAQPDAVDDGLGMSREEILGLDADDDDDDSEDRRGWKRPRTSLSPPRAAVRSSEAADSATSSSDSDASDDDDVLDADFARALNAKFDQSTGSGQII
eukprot:m.874253 g.874253  ORF g.874253 m.874253 type:complete len:962 (+) comp23573_c0_seq21:252-3137(+)